jgi:hypothetical protein
MIFKNDKEIREFTAIVDKFIAGATAKLTPAPEWAYYKLETSWGRRYVRVIKAEYDAADGCIISSSAHCFIDKTNGNVLKAASWKAPAKGARGNIYDDDAGLGRMGPYGTEYNR